MVKSGGNLHPMSPGSQEQSDPALFPCHAWTRGGLGHTWSSGPKQKPAPLQSERQSDAPNACVSQKRKPPPTPDSSMHERTTPLAHSPTPPNINHVTMGANMRSVVAPQVRKCLDHGQNGNAQKLQPHEKACPGARGGQLLLQAAKRKVTSDK